MRASANRLAAARQACQAELSMSVCQTPVFLCFLLPGTPQHSPPLSSAHLQHPDGHLPQAAVLLILGARAIGAGGVADLWEQGTARDGLVTWFACGRARAADNCQRHSAACRATLPSKHFSASGLFGLHLHWVQRMCMCAAAMRATDLGDAVVKGVGPEAVAAVLGGGPHAVLGPVLVDGGIVQEASLRLDLQPKMDRLKEAKQTLQ